MNSKYKNTYVIDMDKVMTNRSKYVMSGNSTLPITKRNGLDVAKTEYITGCSLTCIASLVERFSKLSKRIGKKDASTVIQYLDKFGVPIVTLYPTGETDVLNTQWGNFDIDAQQDLMLAQNEITKRLSAKIK